MSSQRSRPTSRASNISQPIKVVEKNKLELGLFPKDPGTYVAKVTLKNPERYDVRVLEIQVEAKPKTSQFTLEVSAPSRSTVNQTIPITNNSDKDWTIKANIQ